VVEEIEMFNTLAIGLIATTAGLELHFSSLRKVILPILSTSFLKIILLGGLIVAAFFGIDQFMTSFALESTSHLLSLALVFAALCIGTSPAISLAVISETKAKGRLSQLVLGSAIVKDVLMVISLAIAISFAKSITSGGGDAVASFVHLMEELGLSLLAGILLGGIFISYIRFIRQEMFLFVAVMILATAEISHSFHLELLLVFIVAGIVVRNFSKGEEILHDALEKVSLPVFVVFFTNVGAGLNLDATWKYLPIAGILFGTRAITFFISGYLSGKWHGEMPRIQKNVWLGYLPQAGVTLGLISIASKELTEYSELINNIGIGLVTLNLLIGPICLRYALKVNNETDDNPKEDQETAQQIETSEGEEVITAKNIENPDIEDFIKKHSEVIEDQVLKNQFTELIEEFYSIFIKNQISPQKNILKNFTDDLQDLENMSEKDIVRRIDEHFSKMGQKGKDIYHAISLYQKEIDQVLVEHERPVPQKAIKIKLKDSFAVKVLKSLKRPYYFFVKKPKRSVPTRKLAKYNLEPFAGAFSLQLIHSWYRLLGRHIEAFQQTLESDSFGEINLAEQIRIENETWANNVIADFFAELGKYSETWAKQLSEINTVYLSDSKIRYSNVEPEIKESFDLSKKASIEWEEKFIFCRNRLKVIVQTALLSAAVETLLEDKFFTPISEAQTNADDLVKEVFEFFNGIEANLSTEDEKTQALFNKLYGQTKDFAANNLQADIKSKYIRGSFRLLNRDISMSLKKYLPKEEGSFQIASEQTPPHQVKSPSEIMVKKVNLHELFEQNILINFLPMIEEKIEGVSNYLESLLMEMEQAFSILNYSFESQHSSENDIDTKDLAESIHTTITSEKDKISGLHTGLTDYINQAKQSVEKLLEESQFEVKQGVERFSAVSTAKNQFRQKVYKATSSLSELKKQTYKNIRQLYDRFKNSNLNQTERHIDKVLQKKMLSKTLDTTTIRQFVDESYQIDLDFKNLPRVYFRLFGLDPIQDKRFFVAHQSKWQHFEPFSDTSGFRESQKMLIIGNRGMGKSSLLNVAQMDIKSERLIRMNDDVHKNPIDNLARTLSCRNTVSSIHSSLQKQSTTILIDNIDHWLSKTNVRQFEDFLDIIKQSPHNSHWILSISKNNLDSFDKAFKLRSIFNKLIDLNETNLENSREIILGRHRLSGLNIEYPRTFVSDLVRKVGFSTEDEMFFRVLFERSGGHLRQLIYLWLLSLESSDGKTVQLSLTNSIDRGLPMVHEFSTLQKYILAELYAFHQAPEFFINARTLRSAKYTSTAIITKLAICIKETTCRESSGRSKSS
jgi:Kef-type K+ transport system membrane component KefB/energy-coupling factor transporter ATP-binding protein EcfA2